MTLPPARSRPKISVAMIYAKRATAPTCLQLQFPFNPETWAEFRA